MSSDLTSVIPTDPLWQPDAAHEAAASAEWSRLFGDDHEIAVERYDGVRGIDCGENFESVRCPVCGVELDMEWFAGEIHDPRRRERGIWPLDVVTPCCGSQTSLNALDYEWPMGFASWALQVTDPQHDISDSDVAAIADALGHQVRVVRAHY